MMGVKALRWAMQRDNLTTRLTLIAHGATQAQVLAAFPLDEPVIERESSRIAGLNWSAPRADRIWSASEQRTQQTSRILGLEAVTTDEIRDCDYGRWNGVRMDEVQANDSEGILAWLSDPGAAPHGGESIEDLIRRVGSWIEQQRDSKHTIAVTHPAVIRAAMVYALRTPASTFWRFDVAPATLTDLRFSRNLWTIRCAGCELKAQESSEE
jgi:broad specificity phosphatase PhoE